MLQSNRIDKQGLRALLFFALLLIGCLMLTACGAPPARNLPSVSASAETEPVIQDPGANDDAADDAVILADGDRALIIGTNKRRGIELYTLDGARINALDEGALNNVDARSLGSGRFQVAAGNRSLNTLDIFDVNLADYQISLTLRAPVTLQEPYGLCASQDLIFVNDKTGLVQSWDWSGQGPVHSIQLSSQTEDCVYDPIGQRLYVGEENVGIWRINLATSAVEPFALIGDGVLAADVEGLTIYRRGDEALLVASSQGDHTYVIYDIATAAPRLKFTITDSEDGALDGTEDTDGITAFAGALPGYPEGILVAQDGTNRTAAGEAASQNFKIVSWQRIAGLLAAAETN